MPHIYWFRSKCLDVTMVSVGIWMAMEPYFDLKNGEIVVLLGNTIGKP